MTIYEDKNIIVVNKPAGIVVHTDQTHQSGTLIQEILKTHPEIKNVGDPSTGHSTQRVSDSMSSGQVNLRPGVVHRLDKDTSGILVIAKTQLAFEYLKKQFQERKVKKTYLALVVGTLKNKTGVINLPIGRSKKSPLRRLASLKARGTLREAVTEYKILESFDIGCQKSPTSDIGNGKFTLVEAYPKTGRTHQIRVHFKAIGYPLACDKFYSKNPQCPFGLSRHFLHANAIELTLPDASRSRFEADLPDDLEKVLQELRKNVKYDRNK